MKSEFKKSLFFTIFLLFSTHASACIEDNIVNTIITTYSERLPTNKEWTTYFPNTSHIKQTAFVDSSRKNGYYIEKYPNGNALIISKIEEGICYTESFNPDTSISDSSLIVDGKLRHYKMYHPETHQLTLEVEVKDGKRIVYEYDSSGEKIEMSPKKEKEICDLLNKMNSK